jgi:RNA polymerase sigma-70 factor, ECF subfamily
LTERGWVTRDEDLELMEKVARDDERAFAALVERLAPSLLRFVRRTLAVQAAEAEDLVQEVFIRVWKARHRWRPEASVKGYVFTIASRLCLNYARGQRRAPALQPIDPGEEPALQLPDGAAGPDRLLQSGQLKAAIEREISTLPPYQRAVLLLRHAEELSYQEIAVALDTSGPAVESLLSRARSHLRGRLAGWLTEGKSKGRG